MRPYKIYRIVGDAEVPETHGQCWAGERVPESIEFCEYQTIRPILLKYLPKEGRILESGCGLGRWVFYLRQRGFDVTGIDLARPAVEMARSHDSTAPILLDDVLHMSFPEKSFRAAISLGVVEHFEEGPQQALAELRRTLEDDGLLLISVPIQNLLRRLLTHRLKDLFRWYRRRKGIRFVFEEYRFTREEFEDHLRNAGFEIIETVPDDFLPPKNLGLYTDFRVLHGRRGKWELNAAGNALIALLRALSPWIACAGAHWVCKKRPG